jgi:N-acetylglucosaminyldiphosphoundecaprenol N-acetyl-beta-D-mannosaminyltransferase
VRIDLAGRGTIFDTVGRLVEGGQGGLIANVNVHAMNLAWKDEKFRAVLNAADLVFVDGAGVVLGARIAGLEVGPRLTPADWIDELLELCARRNWPLYWLGDTTEVCEAFIARVRERHPACPIAGAHHGFFAKTGAESESVAKAVVGSGARIALIGMSMPIQEKWIDAHREALRPVVCLAVGGLARIYTGHIRRGPRWMTDHGLEWLYRLAMQPGYTWRRYLLGNPLFLARAFLARIGCLRVPGMPMPKS